MNSAIVQSASKQGRSSVMGGRPMHYGNGLGAWPSRQANEIPKSTRPYKVNIYQLHLNYAKTHPTGIKKFASDYKYSFYTFSIFGSLPHT